jgi:hypothetical protein
MYWLDFALLRPNPLLTLSCAMSRTRQRLAIPVRRIDGGGLAIHHCLLCESSGSVLSQELPLADTEGGSLTLADVVAPRSSCFQISKATTSIL